MSEHPISRDKFIKGAAAGTAAVSIGFPAFIPSRGKAADVIKIGHTDPLSGVYADLGRSQVRGAQLALEHWNKRGGVLGREVVRVVEDEQANPGVGVEKVRKLVNEDKCIGIIGTVSSANTLSESGATLALNVPFVDAGGHTDDAVGKQCHWNTFMTCHQTWMVTHATGYTFAKQLGKRWYMVTPDYAFGHSLAAGYIDVASKAGATVIKNVLTPLGTSDFSPYIPQILSAKPDVVIVNLAGNDFINFMKQGSQFGLFNKINVGGWAAELETIWALPPEVRVGYWGSEWYYKGDIVLGKGNTAGKQFAEEYRKRFGTPATARSCFGYVAMDRMLWAISEAKSTDAVKICRALENQKFKSLWEGEAYYRDINHALMWPMWVGKLRPNGTPEDKYDVIDIVDVEPADKVAPDADSIKKICSLAYP